MVGDKPGPASPAGPEQAAVAEATAAEQAPVAEATAAEQPGEVRHKEDMQQELQKLLLEQARQALREGDPKRFDSLVEKLMGTQPNARDDRMDVWRISATG
jgi:hypothetical protein